MVTEVVKTRYYHLFERGLASLDGFVYAPRLSLREVDPKGRRYELCDPKDILVLVRAIADQILEKGAAFDIVVGLMRGGEIGSRLLAPELGLPLDFLWLKRYRGVGQGGDVRVVRGLGTNIKGMDVLAIDDIFDQGITAQFARGFLRNNGGARSVSFAGLHRKPTTTVMPEFWGKDTTRWVHYGPMEDPEFIATKLTDEWQGRSLKSNLQTLRAIGFSPHEIMGALTKHEEMATVLEYKEIPYNPADFLVWQQAAAEVFYHV